VGAAPLAGNLECVGEVEFVLNAELTDTSRVGVATNQVRRLKSGRSLATAQTAREPAW
jgi:hypothetical protein